MASDAKPVIHRGVALMVCENAAILEETLVSIDLSRLDIQRVGDRAIVAPAYQLQPIRSALQERGMFPKIFGHLVRPDYLQAQSAAEQQATDEGPQDEAQADGSGSVQ